MKRYEAFVPDIAAIQVGAELTLVLRDLTPGRSKYAAVHAQVCILPSDAKDADGELQIRSRVGCAVGGIWRFRVTKRLPSLILGTPYSDAFEALSHS